MSTIHSTSGSDSSTTIDPRNRWIAVCAAAVAVSALVAFVGAGVPTAVAQETTEADGHVLVIRGETPSSAYEYDFSASGDVEQLDRAGGDAYRYTGEITSFELAGDAVVTVDGERVDPATLGDGPVSRPATGTTATAPSGPTTGPSPVPTATTAPPTRTSPPTRTPTATTAPSSGPVGSSSTAAATPTRSPTATRRTSETSVSSTTDATSTALPASPTSPSPAAETGEDTLASVENGTDGAVGTIEGAGVGTDTTEGTGPSIGVLGAIGVILATVLVAARRH